MDVGNIKILCGTVGLSQVLGRQLATSRSCCRRTSGLTNAAVSQSTCFTYLLTAGVGESETGKQAVCGGTAVHTASVSDRSRGGGGGAVSGRVSE